MGSQKDLFMPNVGNMRAHLKININLFHQFNDSNYVKSPKNIFFIYWNTSSTLHNLRLLWFTAPIANE